MSSQELTLTLAGVVLFTSSVYWMLKLEACITRGGGSLLGLLSVAVSYPLMLWLGATAEKTYLHVYAVMLCSPLAYAVLSKRGIGAIGVRLRGASSHVALGFLLGMSSLAAVAVGLPDWRATWGFILWNSLLLIPAEELYFRGFAQTIITQHVGGLLGNLAQAVLFACAFYAMGYAPTRAAYVFIAGVVEGELYRRTGSVLSTYVCQTTADILPPLLLEALGLMRG
ncbi:MAG: hypothetical protein DRN96_01680 [Thermoproteota archaeon]|nr:MAG: hypothetical protein DRN96_01680 [Candidatus Korarchaeota archaeon]RLG56196.1 MAG: hypothetical protein DRN99_00235 [Candidatus Korarchaeota archaeon]